MFVTHGQSDARPTVTFPAAGYQIILLGDRHICVNNLPRVALDSGAAGIQTHNLLIASPAPYHYVTEPPRW